MSLSGNLSESWPIHKACESKFRSRQRPLQGFSLQGPLLEGQFLPSALKWSTTIHRPISTP
jgi:hypothetical protein